MCRTTWRGCWLVSAGRLTSGCWSCSSPGAATATECATCSFARQPALRAARPEPPSGTSATCDRLVGVSIYDIALTTLAGDSTTLAPWRGQVALIVNVASKCGLTPQYSALERLHEKYAGSGFTVLGFPSNQFGGQE